MERSEISWQFSVISFEVVTLSRLLLKNWPEMTFEV